MASEQDIVNLRRLLDEGFSKGNLAVVDEIVAADCVEHQRGLRPGVEGVKETIRTLRSWFSDFTISIEDLVIDGDKIWTRNRGRGINTGSVMGNPPTGKPVTVDVYDVVRFEKGKMVEHWGVPDQLGMLMQIGVLKRPEPPASH